MHSADDAGNNGGQFVVFLHTESEDTGYEKSQCHTTKGGEDGYEVTVQPKEGGKAFA
jgi:hypothetical protein